MKKLKSYGLLFFCVLFFLSCFTVNTSALSNIKFNIQGDSSAKTGRIFNCTVCASSDSGKAFAAGRITVNFDTSSMQLKGVSSLDCGDVTFNQAGNSITIVYLNADGTNICSNSQLLKISFKAISSVDNSPITLSADQCIDENENNLTPSISSNMSITITGKTVSRDPETSSGTSKSTKTKDSSDSNDNSEDTACGSTVIAGKDANAVHCINMQNNSFLSFAAGIGVAFALVAVFLVAYRLGVKKRNDKK
ncbi:MAG: cohesin domain-containing protein [Bacillota bacterium]|nr:cohesin domain-containing protein [Bacillota bacterium]